MNWAQLVPILTGAALAIATSFLTRFFSDWYETRSKREQVKRFLFAEISSCVSRIDSLLIVYKQSDLPDPAFLAALERATTLFSKYRESVYFLDVDVGQRVLEFYDGVDEAVEMILSMLRLAQEPRHRDYASKEIRKQMANLESTLSLGQPLIKHFTVRSLSGLELERHRS